MSDTDLMQRFRGPTPPPAIDHKVMQAAAETAANLGDGQGPRLSAEAEKSYSKQSNTPKSREQTTMSDNIVFPCPACGTKYSVSPHHAGKKTTCKKCNAPVTVPTPQVANPTLVGGTRTIRRADIDPGHSTREEAIESGAAVDMTGGASVLRKEETVIGAPPMTHMTNPGTRAPTRRPTAGPRPAAQPQGRPAAYGAPGVPGKKSNMPMLLGIGGGVLGLILLVVVIVVATNTSSTPTDNGTARGDDGGGRGGPTVDADKTLLETHKKDYNNKDALLLAQVYGYYQQADERKDKPEWKTMRDQWAPALARKAASSAAPDELAEIAIKLDNAKYREAEALLDQAWKALKDAGKATKSTKNADGRMVLVPNKTFQDVVTRLGWKPYKRPAKMDECDRYEVSGASEYNVAYSALDQVYHDVELYPPAEITKLTDLENAAFAGLDELIQADKRDGWAIKSREAWIRFKNAQKAGKVDRLKRKRMFSPVAMEREKEDFDSIWTYTYGPSFMVFVEKPIGQSGLDEDFLETLESKKALLRHLYDWFREHLIDKYNLQRVKPKDNAAQAQAEGWPMEIVVLKDSATFTKFAEDSIGAAQPGMRAFYSPLDEIVITYDDRTDADPEAAWFNESVIIHETFHMLSDSYAANPMFTRDEIQIRPRYTSILVQEGLTDSVSGFVRQGDGEKSTYEFMQINHIRLRDFKFVAELLGNEPLYRIRDTIECRHYGQCDAKALERIKERKWKVNVNMLMANAGAVYYATACQISYFFVNYKEGSKYPYRDKWWEFIGLDYQGKITLKSYDDDSAITKFKDVFGIKSDADWDALEKKFFDYTMALKAEDVGKGGANLDNEEDGNVRPAFPPTPGFNPGGGKMPALPGREREEEGSEELEEALVG